MSENVRMWRPRGEDRVLAMAGHTTSYAMEPRGEYVFGMVAGQPMRSRRGRERRLIRPGQLLAWDPSGAHAGAAVDGKAWSSLLIVVEVADLATLAGDHKAALPADIAFPDPVVCDRALTTEFVWLHAALEDSATRLERDEKLAEWLHLLIERISAARPSRSSLSARDDRAFHLACAYLGDWPERNVSLGELARRSTCSVLHGEVLARRPHPCRTARRACGYCASPRSVTRWWPPGRC